MEKVCPRCGGSFGCKSDHGVDCQCAKAKLDNLQRAYVKLNYSPECLCNSCLEEVNRYFYVTDVNPVYRHLKR